jgi:hypothetical protein
MSKKHNAEKTQEAQSPEGGDQAQQGEEQSTTVVEESTEPAAAEVETLEQDVKPLVLGIGQFVRHLLKNSTKSNAEILELVLKTFEGSKTTPACIAWYKTDMRKKGLLDGLNQRGKNKVVEFTAEELAELAK